MSSRWRIGHCQTGRINIFGSYLCAREAARCMSTLHGGRCGSIVNASSLAAHTGAPGEYIDYAGAKAAMDAMTIGLAKELGPAGVRVNGVRPAFIDTKIHALSGPGARETTGPADTTRAGRNAARRGGRSDHLAALGFDIVCHQGTDRHGGRPLVSGRPLLNGGQRLCRWRPPGVAPAAVLATPGEPLEMVMHADITTSCRNTAYCPW